MEKDKELTWKFRNLLEKADKSSLPVQLETFPRGCCWDAAVLLAHFLTQSGHGPFDLITGERKSLGATSCQSHAWLEKDGFVIDITADQFGGFPGPVIVSNDSDWHQTFFTENTGVAEIGKYDGHINSIRADATGLLEAYDKIMENLDS